MRSGGNIGEPLAALRTAPAAQALLRRVERGGLFSCAGVPPAAQPFLAAFLHHQFPRRPIVVVADGVKTQESFQQDLETWLAVRPLFFPSWEVLPNESRLPHADVIAERLETLVALSRVSPSVAPVVVTNIVALMQRTLPAAMIRERTRVLRRGDRSEPLDFIEWLEEQGYEPEAQVTQKGEIALRGGIVDAWPLTSPWPVRLEFFGDELESLRTFNPLTQISREEITEATFPPGGELGLLRKRAEAASAAAAPVGATLLDFLPSEAIVLLCGPAALAVAAEQYTEQVPAGDRLHVSWEELQAAMSARGMTAMALVEEIETVEDDSGVSPAVDSIGLELVSLDAFRPLGTRAPDQQIAEAQRREFFAQLHRWSRQNYEVHVFCNNEGERQRFGEIWQEYGFGDADSSPLAVHLGAIARGFLGVEARLVVVTDAEIFGRYKVQRPRRLKSPHAQAARSAFDINFTELEEGDFVVHLQHGIGRYLGLKMLPTTTRRNASGVEEKSEPGQECLVIEYAAGDPNQAPPRLYVPVSEAHLVGKYVGAGKARPALNTLGGKRWAKAKEQAERAVRDLAAELLAIQAARESQPGHAIATDTPWQREFEGAFIYEETRDQVRAIEATKKDMETPRPMDRLICGDVGFGKTEVAIRAAFKAVMDGKQVAMLVPTTVLAQQHFNTFRERMADYPIRVELLSRFRTKREQQVVVKDLIAGAADIVIGTHRLLQADIQFKDLGLVVIDEEQRFGVLHKEKFKMLRRMVDVLTLSATPIPRTLYLALTGARDMSTIETPPQDRLPVETLVVQYDERLIRDAIQRELNRGGQVFFLHNRVMSIHVMQQKLRALVPHARILVGHGQMHADELEEVMTAFVNGEADVLLSTTIIESGIDIPNANTIIIDRADRFGLSDLYQLRGRVGRYKHQAYAYLLLPRHAALLSDVRKRISAIKQYSTLGSGFKIAMRDLEIRGAGNLLGAEQSGHITEVGFDLYCQLLKQSVAALKGEKVKPRVEVRVEFDFLALRPEEEVRPEKQSVRREEAEEDLSIPREVPTYIRFDETVAAEEERNTCRRGAAFLPMNYIGEARARIDIYRKLAQATDKTALATLRAELRDRFGPLPAAVELLLLVGELKILAADKAVTAIETENDRLKLMRNRDFITLAGKFPRLTKRDAKARLGEIKKLLLAL
ncbi:MAG: transcription-repair coupling factor [Pedosphaera sp.]|nr:transcription-repair coupling factor [Pedosphaera sp.]MST01205.1 transcription-repair coupling factor [Pedosphaera sp.]